MKVKKHGWRTGLHQGGVQHILMDTRPDITQHLSQNLLTVATMRERFEGNSMAESGSSSPSAFAVCHKDIFDRGTN